MRCPGTGLAAELHFRPFRLHQAGGSGGKEGPLVKVRLPPACCLLLLRLLLLLLLLHSCCRCCCL